MLWMLPLAGAAAGALIKKKDPLKGALMGGALGAAGGAMLPAGSSLTGGLMSSAGTQAAAPITDLSVKAAPGAMGQAGMGLLEGFDKIATPAAKGLSAASAAQGLLSPQQAPIQSQPIQSQPVDFSSLMRQAQAPGNDRDRYMQRIQAMMQGGYRG